MSIFAVLTTLSFFSRHALSQFLKSSAICTLASFDWTYNSMDQSPCEVTAALANPCYDSSPIPAIPPGYSYSGPRVNDGITCKCSTVVYSLLSACAACQGGSWISWSNYIQNCSGSDLSRPYVFAIPSGTSVPYWARIDITVKGTWDPDESRAVGDTPEAGPGAVINTPSASAILSSSSKATHSPTATSSKSGGSSNVGAIAGGIVGGIVVISAIASIFFFLGRRKRRLGSPTAPVFDPTPQPLMDEVRPQSSEGGPFVTPPLPDSRAPAIRIYDPEDPSTFPWNQGTDPVLRADTQVPAPSNTGDTLADMATSPPPAYSGLPTV
ncbi:hypothetical protein BGW80DRAFT_1560735 [Lactifluus volemus]|nr:hypothetical protein BGW80DRAFT_1560735 [Lactifluus volemus]